MLPPASLAALHTSTLSSCYSSLTSTSPLLPVVTMDTTLLLPRDLLLLASPLLRSLLPSSPCASSSSSLLLPDCRSADLQHLLSLLSQGSSQPIPPVAIFATAQVLPVSAPYPLPYFCS